MLRDKLSLIFAIGATVFLISFFVTFFTFRFLSITSTQSESNNTIISTFFPSSSPNPTITPAPTLPTSYVINGKTHVFQSFNNCGPATLSMALSYNKIDKSQDELGKIMRPYQITGGDNDDKSVTLQEVAMQAEEYGLNSYLRPNGDIEKLKKFITMGIPVVARTFLKVNEDIGHYRIVRGYDDTTQEIIQDDSLQGHDLRYPYEEFNNLWQPFNYEYLVIVDDSKKELVENILGEELDSQKAWQNALVRIEEEMKIDPNNVHLTFAKSRIYYYLKDYKNSVAQFDVVENRLSFRTLWYQIEPLLSIYETHDDERLLRLSEKILNNQNRAYSELYILRGRVLLRQEKMQEAKNEFEKALFYNKNNTEVKKYL